jgi:hypothetical protein
LIPAIHILLSEVARLTAELDEQDKRIKLLETAAKDAMWERDEAEADSTTHFMQTGECEGRCQKCSEQVMYFVPKFCPGCGRRIEGGEKG